MQLGGQDQLAVSDRRHRVRAHHVPARRSPRGWPPTWSERSGPSPPQELHQLGPPYNSPASSGRAGLEAAYQKQLAGQPGGTITVVGADGKTSARWPPSFHRNRGPPSRPASIRPCSRRPRRRSHPVSQYAALVAVRASTGQVLAAVSVPRRYQFDQALDGEFPPGSTFKVITSTALIEEGLSPASPATCPPTLTVDGEPFHNAEGDAPTSQHGQALRGVVQHGVHRSGRRQPPTRQPAERRRHVRDRHHPEMGLAGFGGSVAHAPRRSRPGAVRPSARPRWWCPR